MTLPPVLFFQAVDASNLNAQSSNTKEILARWDAKDLPAAAFHFREPDPRVAQNPSVSLIKLPSNRLWKARALVAGLGTYSCVVYPGLALPFDDQFRRLRKRLSRSGAVVTTVEGLLANSENIEEANAKLSEAAGHRVYGQPLPRRTLEAAERIKKQSDLIIAISPFLKRVALQIWPGSSLVSIPLGVDLAVFHSRGRLKHGANQRVQIVCAGNMHATKRPDIFLALARRHPDVDFTWFGDGRMRIPLQQEAQFEGLENLFFPGPLKRGNLADKFRAADIFLLPSIAEGVPKVTQEAAACGLPVVCMGYFEPLSVVDGVNGFQAQSDAEFFERVATLIDDADLRSRMGAAGEIMAESWHWDDLAKRWQDQICAAALKLPYVGGE